MKTRTENSEPRAFMAATVLLMLLSVTSMLAVGLTSNFQSYSPARPNAQAMSRPIHSSQSGALRSRITRWMAYLARSG